MFTQPQSKWLLILEVLRELEYLGLRFVFDLCRKNGCNAVNRMNGVMLPGNTSAFAER